VLRILIIVAAVMVAAACDSSQPEPPPTPDPGPVPPSGAERITGSERLGWSQQAANGEELSTFRYLIYVDATAADAQDVSCSATAGPAGFGCTARMPPMSAGLHALTLSSYVDSGGSRLESPRSPAVNVFLVAQTTNAEPVGFGSGRAPGPIITNDGVRLTSEVVANGLDEPSDLALLSDGRMLVAERHGRIRIVQDRRLVTPAAVSLTDVDATRGGLLSIAVQPADAPARDVYALYTTPRGFRLVRFRLVGDTLGDRAILLDGIPSADGGASGFVRIGPDSRLFVGLDDAGDSQLSGDRGSFNGKVLRLNTDATTPREQASGSPVFTTDLTAPRGAAWAPDGLMWMVDAVRGSAGTVQAATRLPNAVRYRLPENSNASAIAVYQAERPGSFRGNVFVALSGERAILRLVPDAGDPGSIASTERLRDESFDRITAIAIASDGAIYVCTSNQLLKLQPRL
jgi:glucose/arabinose dehydrogenase